MRWASTKPLLFALLGLPPLVLLVTVPASADEGALRRQIVRLADKSATVRRDAIGALGRGRDQRLIGVLQSFQQGSLYAWKDRVVRCEQKQQVAPLSDPLTREPLMEEGGQVVVDADALRPVGPGGPRESRSVKYAIQYLEISSPNPENRLAAVKKAGDNRDPAFLEPLRQAVDTEEADSKIARAARESILLIRVFGRIAGQKLEDRLAAVRELGDRHSKRGEALLKAQLTVRKLDDKTRKVYEEAIKKIHTYQTFVARGLDLFNGISSGSILILMALGLSIIFGVMGVINMAHGELMMIGAYTTYVVQLNFGHSGTNLVNHYFLFAIPMAFLTAAFVGWVIEQLVVRHLYGRPLDTLLATYAVGLVLVQAVRLRFGDNIGVNSPEQLRGSFEPFQDLAIAKARVFIVLFCAVCVFLIYLLMKRTRFGLLVRATTQNRQTARSLGVNTRYIDSLTFAFGSGLAGLSGCALTLVDNVVPDMGQIYIVPSFLVVVTGGIGGLAGPVSAGAGIGVLNKFFEPFISWIDPETSTPTTWAKVMILVLVVVFIQWRPAGLFPPKGRLTDV